MPVEIMKSFPRTENASLHEGVMTLCVDGVLTLLFDCTHVYGMSEMMMCGR